MKHFHIFFLFIFLFSCNGSSGLDEIGQTPVIPSINLERTQVKAKEALEFCQKKGYSTDFCLLIDMSLHSGVKRFIIWDFNQNTIKNSFLVSHGCCNGSWNSDSSKDNPTFSNVNNSHCSSLGKYKIGERGYSNWGINVKYLMHGLESSNNNALNRVIVFHSWEAVPDKEVYPKGTPEGWGCPAVSNDSFREIDALLKNSSKPALMWIYN